MKLKKGLWRTESSHKADVVAIKHGMVIGWVNDSGQQWKIDGECITAPSHKIVGSWIVKPEWDWSTTCHWFNWLSYDEDLGWLLSSHEPWYNGKERLTYEGSWDAPVPEEHEPKWKGDFKDSIVCRPGFKPGMEVRA
jgi:hypothetical protein